MKIKHETFEDYRFRLRKLKIKCLGDGLYSHVYQHPTKKNVVVKVTPGDDGYLTYARFAQANPQNPYLPKILDIVPVKLLIYRRLTNPEFHDNSHIFFLEKLDHLEFLNKEHDALVGNIYKLAGTNIFETEISDRRFWAQLTRRRRCCPHLRQLAEFLVENREFNLDLHDENYMVRKGPRGQLQLVFTDPFSGIGYDDEYL